MRTFLSLVFIATILLLFDYIRKYNRRKEPITKNYDLKMRMEDTSEIQNLVSGENLPASLEGKKYPSKAHNEKVKKIFQSVNLDLPVNSAVFIAGNEVEPIKYCDISHPFRQERYFYYLSGVDVPGSSILFNMKSNKLTLFLPLVDDDDVMWSGMPMGINEALNTFDVDEVLYADKINEVFEKELTGFKVFTTDLDNIHDNSIKEKLVSGDKRFFKALDEARLTKDSYEIEVLRHAAKITDNCHLAVISALPIELNEYQVQAEFEYHAGRQNAHALGYDPICCSGPACGTLHYVKNSEALHGKVSFLIDAGAEWKNYTTDVTRCFPISGKFTKEHREIYDAVLDMQTQTMQNIRPGASWDELHLLSHKVLIKHLLKIGIFRKEFSAEEIFRRRVTCVFYPHGLGHLMGLDVHDVAGNPNYEDPDPYFKYLRLRRTLEENMVLTDEPGCYFNEFLIKELLEKYPERLEVVDRDILNKYMYIGGVRIEDDILVTKAGFENLTGITSDPDEIETIVQKSLSKRRSDFHVIV
ncbi:putative Xaa-Pro dipeptidase NDAI_0B02150 [Naumovozyma dairenensis CBS 421]|uniref:Aminopeptidase P N-terminal domain-containing protein n=1 Tax=Naumovozyma dairenensis (strain ATCC 10597 / BCRC 20456 / CBS 421 / NBRC 0211 / NRRL Y-12639) TaxID=1071378 RepID=G0W639_NAUDC|nr:hypothetical protein NDAI_0B02150 [Naumovozyma dairenensis CBS 421]CCD23250.1 hypothetical protein NDAI_0B02150 [Naumovozyma dairenensis CBS 421]